MSFDPNEYVDFGVMDQPPRFASRMGIEAEDFWALGLLHLSKVEIAKLPPARRVAAIAVLDGAERHDPRTFALKAATIVGLRSS